MADEAFEEHLEQHLVGLERPERAGFNFHALEVAIVEGREGSQVVVEVVARPLLVIGDRFDID